MLQMDAYRRRGRRRGGGRLDPAHNAAGSMTRAADADTDNGTVLTVLITVNMFCFVLVITEHLLSPSATLNAACTGAVAVFNKSPRFTYLSLSSQRHCSLINKRGAEQST